MYCPKCGKQIDDNSVYCRFCGYKIKKEETTATKSYANIKKLSLRPVFIPWVTIAATIPVQLFFTLWGGIFFGGMSIPFLMLFGIKEKNPFYSFLFFGLLFFVGIPIIVYIAKRKTYEMTVYDFYDDHLEYYEGFWTVEKKSINYDRITEISLRSGIIQKKYGLGTIFLSTPATGYSSRGRARSGIALYDIPNAESVYIEIKKLIKG